MKRLPNALIDELVDDLEPIRPMKLAHGIGLVALAVLVTIGLVELLDGLWRGILAGEASAYYFIANGMLGLLGAAAALAVLRMASPRVGNTQEGARWALAMFALLPVVAAMTLGLQGRLQQIGADPATGIYVGDHERDIEAGRNAGMKTIAVRYGYIEEPEAIDLWQADLIADTVTDLAKLLQ